jgi:hypothetical protein
MSGTQPQQIAVCRRHLHATLLGTVDGHGPQRAVVVVHTPAVELGLDAVDHKTVTGVEGDASHAKLKPPTPVRSALCSWISILATFMEGKGGEQPV